ncbi:MAG: hypothetical protein ABIN89_17460, partial [Chitinophagaceae bacterium]
ALLTKKVIDNSFEVLAIQMMTVLQAIDYLGCVPRLSGSTRAVYQAVRKIFPKFIGDTPKYKDLERIKRYLEESEEVFSFKSIGYEV